MIERNTQIITFKNQLIDIQFFGKIIFADDNDRIGNKIMIIVYLENYVMQLSSFGHRFYMSKG